jgi:hypothetical protein
MQPNIGRTLISSRCKANDTVTRAMDGRSVSGLRGDLPML